MMDVTSLEIYKTVYYMTHENNTFQIQLTDKQPKQFELYPQLVTTIENLTKTMNLSDVIELEKFEKQLNENTAITEQDYT